MEISNVYNGAHILIQNNNLYVGLDREQQMELCAWLAQNREEMVTTALASVRVIRQQIKQEEQE